jgi:hypothetical protein
MDEPAKRATARRSTEKRVFMIKTGHLVDGCRPLRGLVNDGQRSSWG